MFIKQVFNYRYDFWRYVVGFAIIAFGVLIIGQIPLTVALFLEKGVDLLGMEEAEMMHALDSNYFLFLMLVSFAIGLIFIFGVVKFLHKQTLRSLTTSRRKVDWGRFWFSFALVGTFLVLTTFIDYYFNPEDYLFNFKPVPFLILVVIAVIFIPLQTSFEEYLFRSYLMQGIGSVAGNKWLPLVITSVVFGSLHFFNPEVAKLGNIIMIYYIGTGFMLGIMALMDEGIELTLGFHAANNLVTALLVTADWTAFQTNSIFRDVSEPSAGWDVLIPILIIYPIFLLIFAQKYQWKNWKEKLFGAVEMPENIKVSEEI